MTIALGEEAGPDDHALSIRIDPSGEPQIGPPVDDGKAMAGRFKGFPGRLARVTAVVDTGRLPQFLNGLPAEEEIRAISAHA